MFIAFAYFSTGLFFSSHLFIDIFIREISLLMYGLQTFFIICCMGVLLISTTHESIPGSF